MKLNKLFGLCLLLVCSVGLIGSKAFADESKVYIPCGDLREAVIKSNWEENKEIIENELPTISQVQNTKGEVIAGGLGSLEGAQYAKNVSKLNCSGIGVLDFRPIAGMTNLEEFYSYGAAIDELPGTVLNITPFGKLKKIKSLQFGSADIQDLSVLDKLPNIETFYVTNGWGINLPTVYVDKHAKKFIMEHPVNYSSHFTVKTVNAESTSKDVSLSPYISEGDVIIDNLDEAVTEIEFRFNGTSENGNNFSGFYSDFNCLVPVKWY